jgi:hypothetical protein
LNRDLIVINNINDYCYLRKKLSNLLSKWEMNPEVQRIRKSFSFKIWYPRGDSNARHAV